MKAYKEKPLNGGVQKQYKFNNGYGASVVKHEFSYGNENGLWELAVLKWIDEDHYKLDYSTEISDDVIGYLTEKEVEKLLVCIQSLETKMKPFDLEAAKRGEPIVYAKNPSYAIIFIGVRQDGSIVYEDKKRQLACIQENGLRMAEPRRPEWQQDLIDAVEAGKIVEFNPHTPDFWQTSDPDFWRTSDPDFWQTSAPDFWRTSDPDFWQTSELNRYSSSYDFRGSTKDQFRIRPEKVTRYLWAFKYPAGQRWVRSNIFMSDEEAKAESSSIKIQRLDWSATVFEE